MSTLNRQRGKNDHKHLNKWQRKNYCYLILPFATFNSKFFCLFAHSLWLTKRAVQDQPVDSIALAIQFSSWIEHSSIRLNGWTKNCTFSFSIVGTPWNSQWIIQGKKVITRKIFFTPSFNSVFQVFRYSFFVSRFATRKVINKMFQHRLDFVSSVTTSQCPWLLITFSFHSLER